VTWQPPVRATGPERGVAALLRERDAKRLLLRPMQEAKLTFIPPLPPRSGLQWGFLLRMTGYYDFLSEGGSRRIRAQP
jgi:hypothetical protein